jgi:peroxiredoxin
MMKKMMNKLLLAGASAVLFFTLLPPATAQPADDMQSGPWSGVIINGSCNADEAFAEASKCTAEAPGSPLALYDDTIRQVYALDPQDRAKGHLGDSVTVEGALEGGTIHLTSLRMFSEVGLRTGQKAPDFSCVDQFGKTQTLETLRGRNGMVLLFYRSGDWCPYCKGQLIQLQAAKDRFEKQGLKVAGISYDNVEILKYFVGRRKIEFPLLSDPDSKVIRMYQVLAAGIFLLRFRRRDPREVF